MVEMPPDPVVHLELHTGNLPRAMAFYARLFGWRMERIDVGPGSYHAVDLGNGVDGALWLPYVQVPDAGEATERAEELGARVVLGPREGPVGWRSVVAPPAGAEIALWQPKA
jgi:predicted enzyme related to lactoylglutathione lyase